MNFHFTESQLIKYKVEASLIVGDLNGIISILTKEFYASTPKDQLESEVFETIYKNFKANPLVCKEALNYIIFEYNIKEENSLKKIVKDEAIEKMFEARKLNKELNSELKKDSADNNSNKKLKL